jgi:hypothetical protein
LYFGERSDRSLCSPEMFHLLEYDTQAIARHKGINATVLCAYLASLVFSLRFVEGLSFTAICRRVTGRPRHVRSTLSGKDEL